MKKSTLMVIGIIYIASIVVISVFGLKTVIWDVVIPVKSIECLNTGVAISWNNPALLAKATFSPISEANIPAK